MKLYWPMAKCFNGEKYIDMFTYSACINLDSAIKSINVWAENYLVKEAWIDVKDTEDETFNEKILVKYGRIEVEEKNKYQINVLLDGTYRQEKFSANSEEEALSAFERALKSIGWENKEYHVFAVERI